MNDRFDEDIDKHINVEPWENGMGESWTFGSSDQVSLYNKVMIILYNLASLKDNLKNSLKKNGYSPQIIEEEINNSIYLKVLIDIVNQDKHGSPLRKPRSNINPYISDLNQGLRLGDKREGFDGPVILIDGYIRNIDGQIIFTLDQLVETCYEKFSDLSNKYNC
ncbi:hypothetical protein [Confluentibacter flavum]|uniref:hypothetical protein n=1 Tax=Confluentibacter flavum TaxID=1909700 RepID=UPI0012FED491|nr:hypothetical protein [Confluentibacter flavum]